MPHHRTLGAMRMVASNIEVICQNAKQAIEERNWERARQLYMQALSLKADVPDVHHGLATVCYQMKDLPSAAYHFKEVTRLDPLRAVAHINLGAIYNLLDQLDEAITVLRRGIQLDMHRAEGFYNLGLVYRRKKQTDLAIQAYCEAIRVNPRMVDAHYNLANLYLEKQQYGQAMTHYKAALELRPNWDKALHGLEQAESGQNAQTETASEELSMSSDASPSSPAETPVPSATLDPNRIVDPNAQGVVLSALHKATVESDAHGRQFLDILEHQIEPAIKELSSVLLYPNTPVHELDHCLDKFEKAIATMQSAQSNLQGSIEKIRTLGNRLVSS